MTPQGIIALHWICDCGQASENIEENAQHVIRELQKEGYEIVYRDRSKPPPAMDDGRKIITGDCAQCGLPTSDTELMDFGPHKGKLICGDCWSATEVPT